MSLPDVDPVLSEPHLSCRVMAAVVHELDAAISVDAMDIVLAEAGLDRAYVTDPENWVSTEFVHRFARATARQEYGLDELPPHDHELWQHWRRAARHALRPDVIGPVYRMLRALGSPGRFYQQAPLLHGRANRRTYSELRSRVPGRAVLCILPLGETGGLESPNCWFARGLFEAAPTLWGLPPASVEHRECVLDPDHPADACVYRIVFQERRGTSSVTMLAWVVGGALAGTVAASAAGAGLWIALGAAFGGVAGAGIDGWRRYRRATRFARADVDDLNRLLQEADDRQAELWEEHMALRRSLLVTQKLSGYLASDLTERILEHPELQLTLGGRTTDAAVMFVDIVGFTSRSERVSAAQLVEELNIYFGHLDPNVVDNHGVIDKRIGDGIMAVFVSRGEDAVDVGTRAVRCAMGMLRSLPACNAQLARRQAEPFQIRIGVAAGELVQGNMGSDVRFEYTVIGDVVNLAARLESAAAPGSALVPISVLEALPTTERAGLDVLQPRSIAVKGRTGTFDVVEVRPAHPT